MFPVPGAWNVTVIPDLGVLREHRRSHRLLALVRPYLPGGVGSVRDALPRLPLAARAEAVRLFCDSMEYDRRRAGMPVLPEHRAAIEREAGLLP